MNKSPFILPPGSPLRGRPYRERQLLWTTFAVLTAHLIVFGALLMQGCNRQAGNAASASTDSSMSVAAAEPVSSAHPRP